MKRISSKIIVFQKRIFPVIWFGFLAVFAGSMLFAKGGQRVSPFAFFFPLVMAGFGFIFMRKLVWSLADEVWLCDDETLLIKKSGREERIEFPNVVNVGWSNFNNAGNVTLTLRTPGAFGREVSFMAQSRLWPFARNEVVDDLILRIDAGRHRVNA
ncbi:MAG TPA: hypothetical protein VH083_18835 [Myxococcales bacterium]|nr:hypothetical protein [Myxococcales bacterium]